MKKSVKAEMDRAIGWNISISMMTKNLLSTLIVEINPDRKIISSLHQNRQAIYLTTLHPITNLTKSSNRFTNTLFLVNPPRSRTVICI